jgi:hypothetical protein
MNIISADIIEKVYTKMWNMSEPDAYRLSYAMQKEQPLLVAYLTAVDKDILNQEEREVLFYQGTVIWQIMVEARKPLPQITEDTLLLLESENLRLSESLKNAGTVNFAEFLKRVLKDYGQPEVFRYVLSALLDQDNEDCVIRDENLGIIMLDLKTVIDCFDQ